MPPRVDLAYNAFLGTRGFLIGQAVYRLDHAGNDYTISTVAEARGLASLFFPGQGRATSVGTITPTGLQPTSFTIARTGHEQGSAGVGDLRLGNAAWCC